MNQILYHSSVHQMETMLYQSCMWFSIQKEEYMLLNHLKINEIETSSMNEIITLINNCLINWINIKSFNAIVS